MFVYPIASLSASSARKVRQYIDSGISRAGNHLDSMALNDVYVEQLREAIRRVDRKISNAANLMSVSVSSTETRTLTHDLEKLMAERLDLEHKIMERQ